MIPKISALLIALCATFQLAAQEYNVNKISFSKDMELSNDRKEIVLPEIKGYVVLKSDLHLHSVFSDGYVWPTERVKEAWRDGLDVIALTDHIEYRPFSKYVKSDLNMSNKIAKNYAKDRGIILIEGTEITKDKDVGGHLNALFVKDANKVENEDTNLQIDEAIAQGCFILWNHPGWAIDSCIMFEPNERWIKEGKVHAVEVFNATDYYPRALTWVRDYDIAATANSDAHSAINDMYKPGMRPITLIFATERSEDSVKEALFAKQTLAVFNNNVAGKEKWVKLLFDNSITVKRLGDEVCVITNNSDIALKIKSKAYTGTIEPQGSVRCKIDTNAKNIEIEALNFLTSENTHLDSSIAIK